MDRVLPSRAAQPRKPIRDQEDMRRAVLGLVVMVALAFASRADAAQGGDGRIELRPPSRTMLDAQSLVEDLVRPEWRRTPALSPSWEHLREEHRGPIELRMPEVAAECLDLKVRLRS